MGLFDDEPEAESPPEPLSVIRTYLALAIQIGAPAYNAGDHRGCFDVYACTARLLLNVVEGADLMKQPLRDALERCATRVDVDDQAWIMRRAFDEILDTARDN